MPKNNICFRKLRLRGLKAEALAYTGTESFADADTIGWGQPVMAYLKAHTELGWIGYGTNFGPNGEMTAKDYYKVILKVLGYKQNTATVVGGFTYEGVMKFAASKGLILIFVGKSALRVQPPLVITKEQIDKAVDIIEESINEYLDGKIGDEVFAVTRGW